MFQDPKVLVLKYKRTIMLLKILDDVNAPNCAFKDIMKLAQDVHAYGFSFTPPAGGT